MTLVFVYNADAGFFNAVTDSVHKLLSPQTYACRLCQITHGTFGMLRSWRDVVAGLPCPVEFYHRDEFHRVSGRRDLALPAILARDDAGDLRTVLSAADLDAIDPRDPDPLRRLEQAVGAFLDREERRVARAA